MTHPFHRFAIWLREHPVIQDVHGYRFFPVELKPVSAPLIHEKFHVGLQLRHVAAEQQCVIRVKQVRADNIIRLNEPLVHVVKENRLDNDEQVWR